MKICKTINNIKVFAKQRNYTVRYKTVEVVPNFNGYTNILTQDMINEENVKYVLKYDFDLENATITVPLNCCLEFDGGSIKHGTIIGQDTFVNNVGGVADIFGLGIDKQGTWREVGDGSVKPGELANYYTKSELDSGESKRPTVNEVEHMISGIPKDVDDHLDATSVNPVQNKVITEAIDNIQTGADKDYNPAEFSGLGKVYLKKNIIEVDGVEKNILTQSAFFKEGTQTPNTDTVFVVQYDFDLNGQTIEIPEGCVLGFDGGSINNGTIVGDNTYINALPIQIFGLDTVINGTWEFVEAYSEWFGAKGDGIAEDYAPIQNVLNYFKGKIIHFLRGKTYIGTTTAIYSNTTIIIDGTLTSNSENGISLEFFDRVTSTPGYTGVHDVVICGCGTIDVGGLRYKSQYTPLRIHHCKNILIKDITLRGMYMWHSIECGGTDGLTIDNVTVYATEYDNGFPDLFINTCGTSIQFEDIDAGSTGGAIPYDNTPTKNVIVRNCKFLISENTPFGFSYIGGNHPNDTSDPDGDAVHDIIVENCYFEGSKQHYTTCVLFEASAYNIQIRNCKFDNVYQGRGCVFGLDTNPSKLRVKNVKVFNCEFINCQYGIVSFNSENIYVENSLFRGTEPLDGNATIPNEYSTGDVEVNKRFRGLHISYVDGVWIENNTFTNITLGVNGLGGSNITNKNIYIQRNKFMNICTSAAYIENADGCFVINDNIIDNILLYPTLEWGWDAYSAVGIGMTGLLQDYMLISINRNLIKLTNPNCGTIFYKPTTLDGADVCFAENIIMNKSILTTTALIRYNEMISRYGTTAVIRKADENKDVISVFECYGTNWELVGTYDIGNHEVFEDVIDYRFTGTESILEPGNTYKIEVSSISSPERVLYKTPQDTYPSWYFYGNNYVVFECVDSQDSLLTCRSTDIENISDNGTLTVYRMTS